MKWKTAVSIFTLTIMETYTNLHAIELKAIRDFEANYVILDLINYSKEPAEYFKVQIDALVDSTWKPIRMDVECPCTKVCKKGIVQIPPVFKREVDWDGKNDNCEHVNDGRFRARIYVKESQICREFGLWKSRIDTGIFVSGEWKYHFQVLGAYTKSESSKGTLWKNQKVFEGRDGDTIASPFGILAYYGRGSYSPFTKGWVKPRANFTIMPCGQP